MRQVISTIFAVSLVYGALAGVDAHAAPKRSAELSTLDRINKIIRGEGTPGESVTSQNGDVVYTVLEGGGVEVRNKRYGTVRQYGPVPPQSDNVNSRAKPLYQ
ncbi:hypothetical protein M8997_012190 [Phyllobacterium sp. 21LDTY02-6]|jgi:hypothetical protein|uniref:hypothetical protein n=1 Tax=unclassified Phyllobacterium TaxID=2638441 RepID=UPI0020202E6E|nr:MULTISPECIES: hypothetical protein [unclassified Phyllobacterium]MCO4317942.1 hypothetical protein [Phyllobacterium sp. 21LDTY02-6]MCX8282123.1 hypothetical protein [Phyllobacterium sp. 0TCS1.6C]MCX8296331.1 hypothetical protein [Phyllobacterium sp. 0TCS1.6A]